MIVPTSSESSFRALARLNDGDEEFRGFFYGEYVGSKPDTAPWARVSNDPRHIRIDGCYVQQVKPICWEGPLWVQRGQSDALLFVLMTWWEDPKKSTAAAARAMRLLRHQKQAGSKQGAPPGERVWPSEVFRPIFEKTWAAVKGQLKRRPTDVEVQAAMPRLAQRRLTLGTFRRRWRKCYPGRRWEELTF